MVMLVCVKVASARCQRRTERSHVQFVVNQVVSLLGRAQNVVRHPSIFSLAKLAAAEVFVVTVNVGSAARRQI